MINTELFQGNKRIPLLVDDYFVTLDGTLTTEDGTPVSLTEFNATTTLDVKDVVVLVAVTYPRFKWMY